VDELAAALAAAPQLLSGAATLKMIRVPDGVVLRGSARAPSQVRLPLLALLPLWRAGDAAGVDLPLRASAGLLVVSLPPGAVEIEVTRRTLPAEIVGWTVSLLALAILILCVWRGRTQSSTPARQEDGGSRRR
jgi:hypothetical protein